MRMMGLYSEGFQRGVEYLEQYGVILCSEDIVRSSPESLPWAAGPAAPGSSSLPFACEPHGLGQCFNPAIPTDMHLAV